jgi:hypothetical protein
MNEAIIISASDRRQPPSRPGKAELAVITGVTIKGVSLHDNGQVHPIFSISRR